MEIIPIIQELLEIRNIPQFLFMESIHHDTMTRTRRAILKFKEKNPDEQKIDFIIQSPGGSPADAYRIIRTLRNNFEEVNIIVPFWAKSAATLLSLGATNIIMDEFGEFGPLDIQIVIEREDSPEIDRESALNDQYSVSRIEARSQEMYYEMFVNLYSREEVKINKNELSKQLLEFLPAFYEPLLSQINPYHLGRKKRMLDIGEHYARRILENYNPKLNGLTRQLLVDFLVHRCPEHGYIIDYHLISKYLKNVYPSKNINEKYAKKLAQLTEKFITLDDISFIGFIPRQKSTQEGNQKEKNDVNTITPKTQQKNKHHAVQNQATNHKAQTLYKNTNPCTSSRV